MAKQIRDIIVQTETTQPTRSIPANVELNKWDLQLTPESVPNQDLLRNKTMKTGKRVTNAIIKAVPQVLGDSIAGLGYLGEILPAVDNISDTDDNFSNALIRLGESISEKGQQFSPVYADSTGFNPFTADWWAENIPSIASGLSMFVPSGAVVAGARGLSALSKAGGITSKATKAAKYLGIGEDFLKATGQTVETGLAALAGRHVENMTTAKDMFEQVKSTAMQQGLTEQEAVKMAAERANETYLLGYAAMLTEYIQFAKIFKGTLRPVMDRVQAAGLEGIEEGYMAILEKEMTHKTAKELNLPSANSDDFGDRIWEYLGDPDVQNAFGSGAMGGVLFQEVGRMISRSAGLTREDTLKAKINEALQSPQAEQEFKDNLKQQAEITGTPEAKVEAQKIISMLDTVKLQTQGKPEIQDLVVEFENAKQELIEVDKLLEENPIDNKVINNIIADNIISKSGTATIIPQEVKDKFVFDKDLKVTGEQIASVPPTLIDTKVDLEQKIARLARQINETRKNPNAAKEAKRKKDIQNTIDNIGTYNNTELESKKKLYPELAEQIDTQIKKNGKKLANDLGKAEYDSIANAITNATQPQEFDKFNADIKASNNLSEDQKNDLRQFVKDVYNQKVEQELSDWNDKDYDSSDPDFYNQRYENRPFLKFKEDKLRDKEMPDNSNLDPELISEDKGDVDKGYSPDELEPAKTQPAKSRFKNISEEDLSTLDQEPEVFTEDPFVDGDVEPDDEALISAEQAGLLFDSSILDLLSDNKKKAEQPVETKPLEETIPQAVDNKPLIVEEAREVVMEEETIQRDEESKFGYLVLNDMAMYRTDDAGFIHVQGEKLKFTKEEFEAKYRKYNDKPGWHVAYDKKTGAPIPSPYRKPDIDVEYARTLGKNNEGDLLEVEVIKDDVYNKDHNKIIYVKHNGRVIGMLPDGEKVPAMLPIRKSIIKGEVKNLIYKGLYNFYWDSHINNRRSPNEEVKIGILRVDPITQVVTMSGNADSNDLLNIPNYDPKFNGVAYQLVDLNGHKVWSRLFTKKVKESKELVPRYPILPKGPDMTLYDQLVAMLEMANDADFKDKHVDVRAAVRDIVQWGVVGKDGKYKIYPDFNEKLPSIKKYQTNGRFDPIKWLELNNIKDRPLQVDAIAPANSRYLHRLVTDLGPSLIVNPLHKFDVPNAELSQLEDVSDNEDDVIIPDEIDFQTAPLFEWDKDSSKGKKWYRDNVSEDFPILEFEDIIFLGNPDGISAVDSMAMYLSKQSNNASIYHEAFHQVIDNYKLKDQVFEQAKDKYGIEDINVLEELLADDFAAYMYDESFLSTIKGRVRRFFRWLKSLLGFASSNYIDELYYLTKHGKMKNPSPIRHIKYQSIPNGYTVASLGNRINMILHELDVLASGENYKEKLIEVIKGDGFEIIAKKLEGYAGNVKNPARQEQYKKTANDLREGKLNYWVFNSLSKRGIAISQSLDTIEADNIQFEEDTDLETREAWMFDHAEQSMKDTLSARLRRVFASLPIEEEVVIDGQKKTKRVVDDIGYPTYYDGNLVYNTLQKDLGNSTSVQDMMGKLRDIPIHNAVKVILEKKPDLQSELFISVGQNIRPLVVFTDDTITKPSDSSRHEVVLRDRLVSHLDSDDPSIKTLAGLRGKPEFNDFKIIMQNWDIEESVLEKWYAANPLNDLINAAKRYEKNGWDTKPYKDFVRSIANYYPQTYQAAYFSIKGKKKYSWQRPNFASKFINQLKSDGDNLLAKYSADQFISSLPIFEDFRNGINIEYTEIEGVKYKNEKVGVPYSDFKETDFWTTLLSSFNFSAKEAIINLPILSDAPILAGIKVPKLSTAEAKKKILDTIAAEAKRVKHPAHKREGRIYLPGVNNNEYLDARIFMEVQKIKTRAKDVDASLLKDLDAYVANYIYYMSNISTVILGDPAFYKNSDDWFKRAKEVYSPGTFVDPYANWKGEYVKPTYNVMFVKDVEYDKGPQYDEILEAGGASFTKVSHTDGQSFIDPVTYRQRMIGLKKWDDAKEEGFQAVMKGEDTDKLILSPLKPFYYTHHFEDENLNNLPTSGLMIPTQNKDSEAVILPVYGLKSHPMYNPRYQEYLESMGYSFENNTISFNESKRKTDKISFSTAVKVGAYKVADTIKDAEAHIFSTADWKLQQETPDHYFDNEGLFGTQTMKLIVADLEGQEALINEYNQLISDDVTRDADEVFKEFSSKEKVKKILEKEFIKRGEGVEMVSALRDDSIPLYHPTNHKKIETVIQSLFRKAINKRKFSQGVSFTNVSSYGYDGDKAPKIKWVEDDPKKGIEHIECYVSLYNSALLKYQDGNGNIDIEAVEKAEPNLLKGIVYRIPTEGKYSMYNIKVKGFLPKAAGAGIMLPAEATKISGLDFDIDKMYGFFYANDDTVKRNKDFIREVKALKKKFKEYNLAQKEQELLDIFFGNLENLQNNKNVSGLFEQDSILEELKNKDFKTEYDKIFVKYKQVIDSDNRKLDLMRQALSISYKDFLVPGGYDKLVKNNDRLEELSGNKTDKDLPIEMPTTTVTIGQRMQAGKALIGFAANANAYHAIAQSAKTTLDSIEYDGVPYQTTGNIYDPNGDKISSNLSNLLAAFVDNGKDPQAERSNLNLDSINVGTYMLSLGIPLYQVQLFINQPIIRQFVNETDKKKKAWKEKVATLSEVLSTESLESDLKKGILNEKVLGSFIKFMAAASTYSDIIRSAKLADNGLSTTFGQSLDNYLLAASFPETKDLKTTTMVKKGVKEALEHLIKVTEYPDVFKLGEAFTYLTSKGATFDKVFNEMLLFFGAKSQFYSKNVNNIPARVAKMKMAKIRNNFVDRLIVKNNEVSFQAVVGSDKGEIELVKAAWAEMLNDPKTKEIAIDLAAYTIKNYGLDYVLGGFSQFIPFEIFKVTDFVATIDNSIERQRQTETYDNAPFVDQYVRKNYKDMTLPSVFTSKDGTWYTHKNSYVGPYAKITKSMPTEDGNYILVTTGISRFNDQAGMYEKVNGLAQYSNNYVEEKAEPGKFIPPALEQTAEQKIREILEKHDWNLDQDTFNKINKKGLLTELENAKSDTDIAKVLQKFCNL